MRCGFAWTVSLLLGLACLCGSRCAAQQTGMSETDQLLLEMIAKGYEAQSAYAGDMLVRGKLFQEQRAVEGKSIPAEKSITAHWDPFLLVQKNGRRRYEQAFTDMNGVKTVRI